MAVKDELRRSAVKLRKISAELSEVHITVKDKKLLEMIAFLNERAAQLEKISI